MCAIGSRQWLSHRSLLQVQGLLARGLLVQGLLTPKLLVQALALEPEWGHLLASGRSLREEAEQLGPEFWFGLRVVLVQQSPRSQQAPQKPLYEAKPSHVPSLLVPAALCGSSTLARARLESVWPAEPKHDHLKAAAHHSARRGLS